MGIIRRAQLHLARARFAAACRRHSDRLFSTCDTTARDLRTALSIIDAGQPSSQLRHLIVRCLQDTTLATNAVRAGAVKEDPQ